MKIKKGDNVEVTHLTGRDSEYKIQVGKTYKVDRVWPLSVDVILENDSGIKGSRTREMMNSQIKKVKKVKKIKEGDNIEVLYLEPNDYASYGVEVGKIYKVSSVTSEFIRIKTDNDVRAMYYSQVKKVKKVKKVKVEVEVDRLVERIKELENTIEAMKNLLK